MSFSIRHIFNFMICSFVWSLCAMDAVKTAPVAGTVAMSKPIIKWPPYVYYESFPSAIGDPNEPRVNIAFIVRQALEITRQEADRIDLGEMERVKLDWVYALYQVEKQFLRKPLEALTVEDISLLSSWITRLTAKHPGAFRTQEAKWNLKEFSKEEKDRLEKIQAKRPEDRSDQELDFASACYLIFPNPDTIEDHLKNFLQAIRTLASAVKQAQTRTDRFLLALDLSIFAHTTPVSIHPYEEGSKRLGRMLMFIYLAQNGIEPVSFYNGFVYVDKLKETLTQKNPNAFRDYAREACVVSAQMRRNPQYIPIFQDLLRQGCVDEMIHTSLLNHPLHKAFVASEELKQEHKASNISLPESTSAALKVCAGCQKNAEAIPERSLKICSRCKAVAYCSVACQKNHWGGGHKSACITKK